MKLVLRLGILNINWKVTGVNVHNPSVGWYNLYNMILCMEFQVKMRESRMLWIALIIPVLFVLGPKMLDWHMCDLYRIPLVHRRWGCVLEMKVISSALQSDLFAVSNKVTNLTQIQIMAKATGKDFEVCVWPCAC